LLSSTGHTTCTTHILFYSLICSVNLSDLFAELICFASASHGAIQMLLLLLLLFKRRPNGVKCQRVKNTQAENTCWNG